MLERNSEWKILEDAIHAQQVIPIALFIKLYILAAARFGIISSPVLRCKMPEE